MTSPMVELSEGQKKIQKLALRVTEPDPMDPKAAEILAEQKKARDADFNRSTKSEASAPSSSQLKRKSDNTPKGKVVKRSKNDSPAPIPKEEKNQVTELRWVLRESEDQLQSARDRVMRLENREVDMKKSYKELKGKSEEDYDNLQSLKRATFNHFLAKWETVNESKQGDDITELRLTIPLAIRKFFSEEIGEYKDSLKYKYKTTVSQK